MNKEAENKSLYHNSVSKLERRIKTILYSQWIVATLFIFNKTVGSVGGLYEYTNLGIKFMIEDILVSIAVALFLVTLFSRITNYVVAVIYNTTNKRTNSDAN